MYERFTDAAREVMSTAKEVAIRWKHSYVGTEHLLIALVETDFRVLQSFEVDQRRVQRAVEVILFPDSGWKFPDQGIPGNGPSLTPRAKGIIERAVMAARDDGNWEVGTIHLWHGICGDNSTVAFHALLNGGVNMNELQAAIDDVRQSRE